MLFQSERFKSRFAICLAAIAIVGMSGSLAGCRKTDPRNVKIPGVDGPFVNVVDNKLLLTAVLRDVQIDYGARIPIPKMPMSYLEVGPDFASNGYLINIGLDVNDVKALTKDHIHVLDPHALPGGRPLPGVADGELPGLAVQVPRLRDTVFYFGDSILGTFINVPFPKELKGIMATSRFYDAVGTRIGNISVVGGDENNDHSGFLLLLNLKGKVGQVMAMR